MIFDYTHTPYTLFGITVITVCTPIPRGNIRTLPYPRISSYVLPNPRASSEFQYFLPCFLPTRHYDDDDKPVYL